MKKPNPILRQNQVDQTPEKSTFQRLWLPIALVMSLWINVIQAFGYTYLLPLEKTSFQFLQTLDKSQVLVRVHSIDETITGTEATLRAELAQCLSIYATVLADPAEMDRRWTAKNALITRCLSPDLAKAFQTTASQRLIGFQQSAQTREITKLIPTRLAPAYYQVAMEVTDLRAGVPIKRYNWTAFARIDAKSKEAFDASDALIQPYDLRITSLQFTGAEN